MTKQEAYKAMQDGNKISHIYFGRDEYLYIDSDGVIREEAGINFEAGWEMRSDPDWQTGWFVLKEMGSNGK